MKLARLLGLTLLLPVAIGAALLIAMKMMGIERVPIEPDPTDGQTMVPNPDFPPHPLRDSPIPPGQKPGNQPIEAQLPAALLPPVPQDRH
jgi:hypothetical protein